MSIFNNYQARYESFLEEEYSLKEYLELCREDASVYATATERMLAAIGEPEIVDTSNDEIHNEQGSQQIREQLAQQYNLSHREPDIQIYDVDVQGDRALTLHHFMNNRRPLGKDTIEVVKHIRQLWGYDVKLHSVDEQGEVVTTYAS